MTNFKIFPATITREGQKVPLIKGWYEQASNDPAQIKMWQELFRERITFWGLPCGSVNGIVALDVDVKKANGFESLRRLGYQVPSTLRQDTPSGGSHFLFRARPDVQYRNTVNEGLGLDTRGERGWIAFYGFKNSEPLAEAPDWLFNLAPQPKPVEVTQSPIKLAPEIAEGIIKAALDNIRSAVQGERNNTLNTEAFKIGQVVGSGSITRDFAVAEIYKAAEQCGLKGYEVEATVRSALDGGLKRPMTSPFGNSEPVPSFTLPPPPEAPQRWTPSFLTRHDLLNTSKLKKPQLFRDWSTEDITITTADGGTGKTTLKLFEAICLALGERFLGFECMQRGRTLFITGEDTDQKLAAMAGAIMNQMGLFNSSPENEAKIETILSSIVIKKDADLCLISKDKQGFLRPNSQAMEKLLQAVDDIRPKMIVFDPISSFWGSEAALNDMNKAVTRFMSDLVDTSKACVEMINHMGKSSSANKDMSQFAGRGGSGLPSNSRVSRVLRSLSPEEFTDFTGGELVGDQTAMLCNVNKFSDGSPLFNKPFIIIRNGFLFSRLGLSIQKAKEIEKQMGDIERVFSYIKQERSKNKYPTMRVVIAHFMNTGDPMSEARIKRALGTIQYEGHMGEKIIEVDNPDLRIRDKALVIVDMEGREV